MLLPEPPVPDVFKELLKAWAKHEIELRPAA